MSEIALRPTIAPMAPAAIDNVRRLESLSLTLPQVRMETQHVLHAGLYARTWKIPADTMVTGALIKIATVLIIEGDARIYTGNDEADGYADLTGYNVLTGAAGRKQALIAYSEVYVTMLFPTQAKTVEEAETEFTDEIDLLGSRGADAVNTIIITGV